MKIWLLCRNGGDVGYDEYDAKVIRSSSELNARNKANEETGDEGMIWGNEKKVTCVEITSDEDEKIILASYNAG